MKKIEKKTIFSFTLFIIILTTFIIISFRSKGFFYQMFNTDINSVVNYIQSFGRLSAIVLFFLIILEVVAAPIPGAILYVAAGLLFGGFIGGLISFFANIIGSLICFYLAWKGRTFFFKGVKNKKLELFDKYSERYGGFAIFLLRLNPFTSSDIFSYLAGFSKMRLKHFFIGTTLGLLPITFLSAYVGEEFIIQHPVIYQIFLIVSIAYFAIAIYILYWAKTIEKIKRIEKKVASKVKEKVHNTKKAKRKPFK
ncbi:hypothetical protein BVX95_00555 [archaeon D22]|nr:hypothetical protein BVX95_00555 [archaeon D22]